MKDEAGRREHRWGGASFYSLPSLPVSFATIDHIGAGNGACAVMHVPRPGLLGGAGIAGEMPGLACQGGRIERPELEETVRGGFGKADYSIVGGRRAAISAPVPPLPHCPAVGPESAGVFIRAVLRDVDVYGLSARRLGRVDVVGASKDMIRTDKDAGADRVSVFGLVIGAGDNPADVAKRGHESVRHPDQLNLTGGRFPKATGAAGKRITRRPLRDFSIIYVHIYFSEYPWERRLSLRPYTQSQAGKA